LTGGLIKAGFHEVVVNEATIKVRFALVAIETSPLFWLTDLNQGNGKI